MKIARLIPQPKAAYPEAGSFAPPPGAAVYAPVAAEAWTRRLGALLNLPVRLAPADDWEITVGSCPATDPLPVPDKPDAYALAVEPDRIRLAARSYRGLVYAVTTLEEIGTGCGRVVDFADLPVRGIHFDLKGPALEWAYLRSLVERLGRLKINTLLLEYEDKFPFRSFPDVVGQGALTPAQLKELVDLATAWGMAVIPLVQCLGHAEYMLKHPAYRHLAESEALQQLCPLHVGSLELFAAMVDEVREAHPSIRYFHIGGDESWSLGSCPKCRVVAETDGKKRLYVDYIKQAASLVIARGLTPIIWDDMFHEEKAHPLLDELPAGTALMAWEYQVYEDEVSHVRWGVQQRYASRRFAHDPAQLWGWSGWLEDLPAEEQELIRTVKFGGGDMGLGDPVPWVRAIQARGREVFGASASKGADHENTLWPSHDRRYANVAVWARRAHAAGLPGVVSTAWTRFSSNCPPVEPWETSWYTTMASAELYWNSQTTKAQFDQKFGPLAPALDWLATGRRLGDRKYLQAALGLIAEQGGNQVLEACVRHELLLQETALAERAAGWHLHYIGQAETVPIRLPHRAGVVKQLDDLAGRWAEWEAEAAHAFAAELQPAGLMELIGTKTAGPKAIIAWLKGRLTARPVQEIIHIDRAGGP